ARPGRAHARSALPALARRLAAREQGRAARPRAKTSFSSCSRALSARRATRLKARRTREYGSEARAATPPAPGAGRSVSSRYAVRPSSPVGACSALKASEACDEQLGHIGHDSAAVLAKGERRARVGAIRDAADLHKI